MSFGKLYLVPNLLGATKPEQVLPSGTLEIVKKLQHFVVENTRTSRRVLSRIGMDNPIDTIEFIELDKHNARNLDLMEHLGPCLQGEDMGLMSEAGTPCLCAFVKGQLSERQNPWILLLTPKNCV